jgi:transposase InsO family protein
LREEVCDKIIQQRDMTLISSFDDFFVMAGQGTAGLKMCEQLEEHGVAPDTRTVMQQLTGWFEHYNTRHPHSALKYLPPRMFREKQASIN